MNITLLSNIIVHRARRLLQIRNAAAKELADTHRGIGQPLHMRIAPCYPLSTILNVSPKFEGDVAKVRAAVAAYSLKEKCSKLSDVDSG